MTLYKIASITPVGSAGSATGSSGVVFRDLVTTEAIPQGFIMGAYIDFTSQHANTDVTISRVMPNGALVTYLITTNVNTDGWYPVKEFSYSTAGVVSTTDLIYPRTPNGRFQVDVAQGSAVTNGVVVWVDIE